MKAYLRFVLHSEIFVLSEDFEEQWKEMRKYIIKCGVLR